MAKETLPTVPGFEPGSFDCRSTAFKLHYCDIRAWNCLRGHLSATSPIWYVTNDPSIICRQWQKFRTQPLNLKFSITLLFPMLKGSKQISNIVIFLNKLFFLRTFFTISATGKSTFKIRNCKVLENISPEKISNN